MLPCCFFNQHRSWPSHILLISLYHQRCLLECIKSSLLTSHLILVHILEEAWRKSSIQDLDESLHDRVLCVCPWVGSVRVVIKKENQIYFKLWAIWFRRNFSWKIYLSTGASTRGLILRCTWASDAQSSSHGVSLWQECVFEWLFDYLCTFEMFFPPQTLL